MIQFSQLQFNLSFPITLTYSLLTLTVLTGFFMFCLDSACEDENHMFFRLFKSLTGQGKIISPELLTLSAFILLSFLDTYRNLKKTGEITNFDFPTSQCQRERTKSEPVSNKNYPG